MAMLDVGCGTRKHKGCIGLEIRKLKGVDIVADAHMIPFKSESFDKVFLSHVIEHVGNFVAFMKEMWRVSKKGATICIWTPHFTAHYSYSDPTHKHHLTSQSFDYFDKYTVYGKHLWFTREFEFRVKKKIIFFPKRKKRFWNYLVERFANKDPMGYESMFGWIFPAESLYFELETVK